MNAVKFHSLLKNISKSKISTSAEHLSFLKSINKMQSFDNKNSNRIKDYPLCLSVLTKIKKPGAVIKNNNPNINFNFNIIKNIKFFRNNSSLTLNNSNDSDINNNLSCLKKNKQQIFSYDQKINCKKLKSLKLQHINQINKIFTPKTLNVHNKIFDFSTKNCQKNDINFSLNKKLLSNSNNTTNKLPFDSIDFSFKLKNSDNKNNKISLKSISIKSGIANKKSNTNDVIIKNENNSNKNETKIIMSKISLNNKYKKKNMSENTNNNQKDRNIFNKKHSNINKNNISKNYNNQNNINTRYSNNNNQNNHDSSYKNFIHNNVKLLNKLNNSNSVLWDLNKKATTNKNIKLKKNNFKCFDILIQSKSKQQPKFINKIKEDINLKLMRNNINSKIYNYKSNLLFQYLISNIFIRHYNPRNIFIYENDISYYYKSALNLIENNNSKFENSMHVNKINCNIRKELMNSMISDHDLLNIDDSNTKFSNSSKIQNEQLLKEKNNIRKIVHFPINYVIIHSYILHSFYWTSNPIENKNKQTKILPTRKVNTFKKNTVLPPKNNRSSFQFAALRKSATIDVKRKSTIIKIGSLRRMKSINNKNKPIEKYSVLTKKNFFEVESKNSKTTGEILFKENKNINNSNKNINNTNTNFNELNIADLLENPNSFDDLYTGFFFLILKDESKAFKKYYEKYEKNADFDKNKQFIDGDTLIIMSAKQGNKDVLKFLCEKDCDVNIQNDKGNTALHYAIALKFYDIVDILTIHGAREDILNLKGLTPWNCMDNNVE